MSDWKYVYDEMPKDEIVVLIHVKALGEHGVVSAWWCSDDEPCWVALDDDKNYDLDECQYWRYAVDLPVYKN